MIRIFNMCRGECCRNQTMSMVKSIRKNHKTPWEMIVLTDMELEFEEEFPEVKQIVKQFSPKHEALAYLKFLPEEWKGEYVYHFDSDLLIYDTVPELEGDFCCTYDWGKDVEDNEYMFTKIADVIKLFEEDDPSFRPLDDLLIFVSGVYGFKYDEKMEKVFEEANWLLTQYPVDFFRHPLNGSDYTVPELFLIYVLSKRLEPLNIDLKYMDYHQVDFKKRKEPGHIIYHYLRAKFLSGEMEKMFELYGRGEWPVYEGEARKQLNLDFWKAHGTEDFKGYKVIT